ncbi:GNAT family N-acetyltransferase [Alkalihalobacterium elongatum]|uniref:GNAT family N-acetyltransferase n=1 Tax=Alkalihalobacterium elongatum TaxID=2675466 RepID=UPI001C1F87DA|nr:GNAT family N-acetyltransferase [Alkalihalobacterium elongatum]
MEVRKLTKNDIDESFDLSQFAFQYTLSEEEREHRRTITRPEDSIGYYSDGELLAKMTTLPLQIQIEGVSFEMGGVSGVATYPEYRRSGLVKNLLQQALKEMKENGQSISCLFPFSIPFYRKYGWELFVDYQKLTMTRDQLPKFNNVSGIVKKIDGTSIEVLKEIYDNYSKSYTGMLIRNDNWWKDWVFYRKKGRMAVYINPNGTPRGYIIYEVKERKMTIKELVTLDEESRIGLWNFIANHDSMADEYIILQLPLSEPYPYWLPDPKIQKEVVPYFMARIVDVEKFLQNYPFNKRSKSVLFLHVVDNFAVWNSATYQITINESEIKVIKHEPKEKGTCQQEPKRGIFCNINDLTAVLLNYQCPSHLFQMQRIKGRIEEIDLLKQLTVKNATGFIDFF